MANYYQDYRNQEIDAVIELPEGDRCAFEIKLGANLIDAAAANLLTIQKQIEEGPKEKPPAVLCVICGMSNAAYCRMYGVFVVLAADCFHGGVYRLYHPAPRP